MLSGSVKSPLPPQPYSHKGMLEPEIHSRYPASYLGSECVREATMCHRCWSFPCVCDPTIPQWETPATVALDDRIAELRSMEAAVVLEAELILREAQ